jgi:hypothetical protein
MFIDHGTAWYLICNTNLHEIYSLIIVLCIWTSGLAPLRMHSISVSFLDSHAVGLKDHCDILTFCFPITVLYHIRSVLHMWYPSLLLKTVHTNGQLTPWNRVLLEKLSVAQLLKNFPTFYGTQMFVTVFTRALHWSVSWASWMLSILCHPISVRFILLLSSSVLVLLVVSFLRQIERWVA